MLVQYDHIESHLIDTNILTCSNLSTNLNASLSSDVWKFLRPSQKISTLRMYQSSRGRGIPSAGEKWNETQQHNKKALKVG